MCITTSNKKEAFNNNNQYHRTLDCRDICKIKCLPKIKEKSSTYFAGYMTTLSFFLTTVMKLHINMYISLILTNIDIEMNYSTCNRVIAPERPKNKVFGLLSRSSSNL